MKEQLLNKVENIVAKGKIAYYEQYLLLPQCFQKLSAAKQSTAKESVCGKTSYRRFLTPLQQTAFRKHCDKRRNCSKKAISPFATIFSTFSHRLSIQL